MLTGKPQIFWVGQENHMKYQLNSELFVIPDEPDKYILFLPLEGRVLSINPAGLKKIYDLLVSESTDLEDEFLKIFNLMNK